MVSKEYINEVITSNGVEIENLLNSNQDTKTIYDVLKKIGRLPGGFNGDLFIPFIEHKNHNVRLLTVKNIGKLSDDKYLKLLSNVALNDPDSMVRREAISSIGRMRSKKSIEILVELLQEDDPKMVLQAIRGLLVFKNIDRIKEKLRLLVSHPNELVQAVIEKEFETHKKETYKSLSHSASFDFMKNTVVGGDFLEISKSIPDDSIHLTFTSPPYYNARDYSIYKSYKEYLHFLNNVFNEVHRITKEGRFFIVNTSPIIIPRVSRQHSSKRYPIPFDIHYFLVKMGWEFIDDIIWVKPEASVKNRNAGFLQHRKPLAYKPNAITEYIMVYRKKTTKLIDWNMRKYDAETVENSKIRVDYETSNVWSIDPTFDRVHSAVFPYELCRRVISFYSFEGDLVLDPFAGSGTVGKAAQKLGRYFFLTEIAEKYIKRIKTNLDSLPLLDKNAPKFMNLKDFIKTIDG